MNSKVSFKIDSASIDNRNDYLQYCYYRCGKCKSSICEKCCHLIICGSTPIGLMKQSNITMLHKLIKQMSKLALIYPNVIF